MKKITILTIALMMTLSLSACGKKTIPDGNVNQNNEIVFTAFDAIENENCLIRIKEIYPENKNGFTIKIECENKSKDKNYIFSIASSAVNGIQYYPYTYLEVASGQTLDIDVSFTTKEFIGYEIDNFTDIEITFYVYDSSDLNYKPIVYETIHIYPYGEDKAVKYVREPQKNDNVIIDNEYATVIVTGYNPDGKNGYTVNLFLINKTDDSLMYSVEELSINGYEIAFFYADSVFGGNCYISFISIIPELLEEKNITEVETIKIRFRVFNIDSQNSIDYANDIIVLKP
ncbi:MAG: lipoprotein [Erysipelotrichaceae bacterium]|jgi:hypothetical protein